MPGGLLPADDLYARLEVDVNASPEAIEVAWRALLKRHHPDVAGGDDAALDRAKRINVAHDWLSDPALRARYDAEALGLAPVTTNRRGSARRPGFSPRGSAGDRDGRRSGAPLVDPGRPRPRRPGGAPRPVPRPRGAPDAGRAGPAGRRGAAADRVPRHGPPVPRAGRQGRVRRCRGRARATRAARSLGTGRAARGAARRRRGARAGAVPRRPAGRAVPRARARPAAACVGCEPGPAAVRAQRRGRRRGPRPGRDAHPRRARRVRPGVAGHRRVGPAVAGQPRPRGGRGAPDLGAARRARRGGRRPGGGPRAGSGDARAPAGRTAGARDGAAARVPGAGLRGPRGAVRRRDRVDATRAGPAGPDVRRAR